MQLNGSRALVTGAGGDIGRAFVGTLLLHGVEVLMIDRDSRALEDVTSSIASPEAALDGQVADLARAEDRQEVCRIARSWHGGINILVNNAGLNPFGMYEDLAPAQIDLALAVNLQAPMHLCRDLLPHLRAKSPAAIVNMGSVFGAIGYPGYVAYSATKFALRGFTEALRRELAGSGVAVQYLAPRATGTTINSPAVERMNRELRIAMDPPARVADALIALLRSGRASATVGWPEAAFVRLNAVLPSVVDRAVRGQLPVIERHARAACAGDDVKVGRLSIQEAGLG